MLIAIISDIHNNLTSLKKALDYCAKNNVEKIICCGDLASLETLDFLNDNFSPNLLSEGSAFRKEAELQEPSIFYVFGNMDNDYLKNYPFAGTYKKTRIFEKYGNIEIKKYRVAFVHFPDEARKLAESGKYDFVFHGHTHKPWTEVVNNCTILNPGNVAGEIYPATFAVWNTDDDKFQLIRISELE